MLQSLPLAIIKPLTKCISAACNSFVSKQSYTKWQKNQAPDLFEIFFFLFLLSYPFLWVLGVTPLGNVGSLLFASAFHLAGHRFIGIS